MRPNSVVSKCISVLRDICAQSGILHGESRQLELLFNSALDQYTPAHFIVEEFVSEPLYKLIATKGLWLMDLRIVWTADAIWEHYKDVLGKNPSVYINGWKWGHNTNFRGFREYDCGIGALMSMHKEGKAIDFDIAGVPAEDVRREILDNQGAEWAQFISRMENDTSWVHIDCAETVMDGIQLFGSGS